MNAGLIFFHGNGESTCKDTVLLLKAMNYFKDLKENGPFKGDYMNGRTWYPLAERRYISLTSECRKRPPNEYFILCKKADSLFKENDYKNSAFTYCSAFKVNQWKGR